MLSQQCLCSQLEAHYRQEFERFDQVQLAIWDQKSHFYWGKHVMNHGISGCFFFDVFLGNYPIYICILYSYKTNPQSRLDHERHFRCQDKSGNINASELRHVLSSSELALTKRKVRCRCDLCIFPISAHTSLPSH